MSVHRDDIMSTLSAWLSPERFTDYCPNGLQVEGREQVARVVSGVTASQQFLDNAIADGADMVLVHHGYFWKGEDQRVQGMKKRRIETLIRNGVSLVAFHLPLDAHPELGNNACLGRDLAIDQARPVTDDPLELLWQGEFKTPLSSEAFAKRLESALGQVPVVVGNGPEAIRRIAWCSGGAQGMIDRAAALGVDAFMSGEISEPTVHSAREQGLYYFAAGHHATERGAVQATGERLAAEMGVVHRFIDDPSPA